MDESSTLPQPTEDSGTPVLDSDWLSRTGHDWPEGAVRSDQLPSQRSSECLD